MINTRSIISGYIFLQGNFVVHLPMLVSMIAFVRIPNDENLSIAFPGEERLVGVWYFFNAFMHGLLSIIQMRSLVDLGSLSTTFEFMQILGAIAQMFNLCMMMRLYGTSVLDGEVDTDENLSF